MKNIVGLEINNLPDQVKEEYYKQVKEEYYELIRKRIENNKDWRWLVGDEDWKYFKDNHTFDELLEVGFWKYPQEFIAFSKKNIKTAFITKTLKQHDFKDLGYKDLVKDLSQEEKEGIIDEILIQVPYLSNLSTRDYPVVYLEEIDKKFIEKNQWLYSREELEQYYQNKFILTKVSRYPKDDKRSVEIPPIINKFFKNEDEVIVFVMEDGRMTHEILNSCTDNLNPHHKVNNLIEKKYELEQLKKDKTISKNKKVEQPKKKM
ncbi:hypothetical protein [Mesomycoplasma ovipneumoniae]|uniref:hypothetical protein n=1 Tax=Mesomycoplasma ovipneumoniae TaxID=29562 RepID=UPI0028AFE91E|nr:hypothetical protein [Mesomycoplasma ovipneumoniae]WNM16381.1 hypothetical protein RNM19_03360 [Mesomycoplasma ovipneumoniae]